MLVTCPAALVLPGAVAVPHEPVTLGVVVNVTGSSKATPDPLVTVAVIVDVVAPSSGTLVGLAVTVTALATLLASALMLAATWKTARAESRLQQLHTEIAQSQDRLAKLRAAQFTPKNHPFKAQGRTFIELEETK